MIEKVIKECQERISNELGAKVILFYRVDDSADVTLGKILTIVCDICGVNETDLFKRNRRRPVTLARQLFYYTSRMYTNETVKCMSSFINQDHTTAVYGHQVIQDLIYIQDQKVVGYIGMIKQALTGIVYNPEPTPELKPEPPVRELPVRHLGVYSNTNHIDKYLNGSI